MRVHFSWGNPQGRASNSLNSGVAGTREVLSQCQLFFVLKSTDVLRFSPGCSGEFHSEPLCTSTFCRSSNFSLTRVHCFSFCEVKGEPSVQAKARPVSRWRHASGYRGRAARLTCVAVQWGASATHGHPRSGASVCELTEPSVLQTNSPPLASPSLRSSWEPHGPDGWSGGQGTVAQRPQMWISRSHKSGSNPSTASWQWVP